MALHLLYHCAISNDLLRTHFNGVLSLSFFFFFPNSTNIKNGGSKVCVPVFMCNSFMPVATQ